MKDQEIVVIDEKQIIDPEKSGSKLTLQKSWIADKQLLKMLQRTPRSHVYTRPGKGGGTFDFVTGNYFKKVLNHVFAWNWDFEVVSFEEKYGQIVVLGKLTVKGNNGESITKTQFGRAEIKKLKGTNNPVDYGNDMKAAATDALKKCASELGIASDIYGKNEFKEIGVAVKEKEVPTTKEAPKVYATPKAEPKPQKRHCSVCAKQITDQEAEFSKKVFKKELCRSCQAIKKNKK